MKSKSLGSLEESENFVDIFEDVNQEIYLLEPSGPEMFLLEEPDPIELLVDTNVIEKNSIQNNNIVAIVFDKNSAPTKRSSSNIESRIDSTLSSIIEHRIKTKALPLALRKRLMYERAVNA